MLMTPMRHVCLGLLLLFLSGPLLAQALDLYEGEIAVGSQSAAERDSALPAALGQMLVRLSGDTGIAADPAAQGLMQDAPGLVQRYRYRQHVEVQDGLPVSRTFLVARFDPARVDAALAAAGIPVWLPPRPQPVVWLVIDDGSGPRLLGATQAAAVAALSQRAAQRGLQLQFPQAEAGEQTLLGDIAAGRGEYLGEASATYGSGIWLLGSLMRGSEGWRVRWSAYEEGEVLGSTTAADADAASLLRQGADLLADSLAARYRIAAGGELERIRIALEGLAPLDDYARAMAYLQRLPGVQRVQPVLAEGERLSLEIDLPGGLAQLERLVALGRVLVSAEAGSGRFLLRR
jgi:uncharacterized protein